MRRMISYLDMIRRQAHPTVVQRGVRYFVEGRVHDFEFDGETATATVFGTRPYRTRIRFVRPGVMQTWCTCEAYASYGETCKHVVAVLAAIDGVRNDEPWWRKLSPREDERERKIRYRVRIEKAA